MLYLCTPFSRAAVDRLNRMNVSAYKIGSGECNNYALVEYISSKKKPVILSTGMNDINSIHLAVDILRKYSIPFALMHCTSMYPTPYDNVDLNALTQLHEIFPDAVLGLSDHSVGCYTAFASIALGARIIEKHFVSDQEWSGPDVPISLTPSQLEELIRGTDAIYRSLGGQKRIQAGEEATIRFAYASVVSTRTIRKGELLSENNVWVKRPGTGEIRAGHYKKTIGMKARRDIESNVQIKWSDLG